MTLGDRAEVTVNIDLFELILEIYSAACFETVVAHTLLRGSP